jgi:hypothetical protein
VRVDLSREGEAGRPAKGTTLLRRR